MIAKKCKKCGKEVPLNALECPYCGSNEFTYFGESMIIYGSPEEVVIDRKGVNEVIVEFENGKYKVTYDGKTYVVNALFIRPTLNTTNRPTILFETTFKCRIEFEKEADLINYGTSIHIDY